MKKVGQLPEKRFLQGLFFFISACFLIAAVWMPDRGDLFSGYVKILTSPCKITTNYFSVGGLAATFFNIGTVALFCTALFCIPGAQVDQVATLAFFLTLGFGTWGTHVLNMLPSMVGVLLYALVKKEKISSLVPALIFSTGSTPLMSELMLRYPGTEIGFHLTGILLALAAGIFIGFCLPAGLRHSPSVHKGFDLFSAAVPVGMCTFVLHGLFYKAPGISTEQIPTTGDLHVAAPEIVNIFCIAVFALCILGALCMGCKLKDYCRLLWDIPEPGSYSARYGNSVFLMNVGVYGFLILGYYNLVGAEFNGVTFGIMFGMLSLCNSGGNPLTVAPIMLGYITIAFLAKTLSPLTGGVCAMTINAQPILIGVCYAAGLAPISGKYGVIYGFFAAMVHYLLVTLIPSLHGGFCLYNGGFTAAMTCLAVVPQLERFCKTRSQRRERRLQA